jgi:hypothetical protein
MRVNNQFWGWKAGKLESLDAQKRDKHLGLQASWPPSHWASITNMKKGHLLFTTSYCLYALYQSKGLEAQYEICIVYRL